MAIGIKVGDIMTRNFVSVKPETSILDAAKEMIKKRVGSLVIKDKQTMTGLLTEKDIIWAITKKSKKEFSDIKARDIAVKKIITVKPSSDLYEALNKMKKYGFRVLPVVSQRRVIGVLTIKDILRIQPDLIDSAKEIMSIKEETDKLKRLSVHKKWTEGLCEECGNIDLLYKTDGQLLCEGCLDSM